MIVIIIILSVITINSSDNTIDESITAKEKAEIREITEQANIIKTESIIEEKDLTKERLVERILMSDYFLNSTLIDNEIIMNDKNYKILINDDLKIKVVRKDEITTIEGTWTLNDSITYPNDFDFGFEGVLFNDEYSYPISNIYATEIYGYYCLFQIASNPYYPYGFTYIPKNDLGFPSGWVWGAVATNEATPVKNLKLKINSKISEISNGEAFLEWLKANAIKD